MNKKYAMLLIASFTISQQLHAQEKTIVSGIKWGDHISQVKKKIPSLVIQKDFCKKMPGFEEQRKNEGVSCDLVSTDKYIINNMHFYLSAEFGEDDSKIRSIYISKSLPSNTAGYKPETLTAFINTSHKLKESIIRKYGEPSKKRSGIITHKGSAAYSDEYTWNKNGNHITYTSVARSVDMSHQSSLDFGKIQINYEPTIGAAESKL